MTLSYNLVELWEVKLSWWDQISSREGEGICEVYNLTLFSDP